MPKLDGIVETAIHTEDMVRARAFYEAVLGLEPIYGDNRLCAYAVAGRDVLLVFRKGTTGQTVVLPSGTIPGHGGDGALHVAFAIGKDELDRWETHLASRGVAIEGVSRRPQRLFPRCRRAPFGTRNARIVVGVLGATNYFPGLALRQSRIAHDLIHRGSQA
jgi:catechol 2,3-dioxygenase-like lactoylglutathione lyase family enzyme